MSRSILLASIAALTLAAPVVAHADATDPQACSVTVEYSLNNVLRLSYQKDFVVAVDAPFSDDFSTATRFRFFDAFLTVEDGVPLVSIAFDADVSVFNAVAFGAELKVTDPRHGSSTSGNSGFFTSVPGAAGSHRTAYTLTCQRAN
jgi:hypothetical protein